MSDHSVHDAGAASVPPPTVTRCGALTRLFGLAGAAAVAAALPAVAEASKSDTVADLLPPAAAEPVTVAVLPDWLRDQPDWLVANVEQYARALATLRDPLAPYSLALDATRESMVGRYARVHIAGMNVSDEELDARLREIREKAASTPREVAQDRIVTVRIPRLDRNERSRLRRWLAKLPTGERDPRVVYRTGRRGKHQDENEVDFLHVVAPARRSIFCPSPMDHAATLVAAAGTAIGRPLARTYLCAHYSPTEHRGRAWLYEWPDGEVTWYRVRRGPADAA